MGSLGSSAGFSTLLRSLPVVGVPSSSKIASVSSPHRLRGGEQCESPSSTKRCNWGSSCAIWRRRYGGTRTNMGSARGSSLRSTPVRRTTTASTVGRVMWELIEPLDEEGIHARFLAEKGEGIHPSAGNGGSRKSGPAVPSEARGARVGRTAQRTLPTRSNFRWMPLHPSRNTIEGTLMEGGSEWARFCGTVRATTDEIGTSVRSERKRHHERKDAHEADDHDHGHRRRRDAGA